MSDSELHKKNSEVKPETQFKAENIGKWASKQENPFAEQNRKAAAKKQRESEQSQKAAPAVAIILGAAAVVAAICGLAVLIVFLISHKPQTVPDDTPTIAGSSAQDIVDYQNILNEFYNQSFGANIDERMQQVQEVVDNSLQTDNGKEYSDLILLAQAQVYLNNGLYRQAIDIANNISPDSLNAESKHSLYNILYAAYSTIGDQEKAQEYFILTYTAGEDLNGAYGN